MEKARNSHIIWSEHIRLRWDDNIKTNLEENQAIKVRDRLNWLKRSFVNTVTNVSFHKSRELPDQMSNCQLSKEDCAPFFLV
jgi:hypothetical protein